MGFRFTTERDADINKTLSGLVKFNHGVWRSAKQANFFLNTPMGQKILFSTEIHDENHARAFWEHHGVHCEPGQHVVEVTGISTFGPRHGARVPIRWSYVVDEYGVVAKYRRRLKDGQFDPNLTEREFKRFGRPEAERLIGKLAEGWAELKASEEKEVDPGEHFGYVGQRFEDEFTCEALIGRDGPCGFYYIHFLRDSAGRLFCYNGKEQAVEGELFRARFTVKGHFENRRGEKTTSLSRPYLVK